MSRPQFTSLRLSLLALAVSATLPTFAFATETMTVTATGNARSFLRSAYDGQRHRHFRS